MHATRFDIVCYIRKGVTYTADVLQIYNNVDVARGSIIVRTLSVRVLGNNNFSEVTISEHV